MCNISHFILLDFIRDCYVDKAEKLYNTEITKFGNRLRCIRENKDITQLQLEVLSGIDRSEISRIENGLRNIEFLTIVKLAVALDITVADFFNKS